MYTTKKQNNLLNDLVINQFSDNIIAESSNTENVLIKEKSERILKLEELQKENSDIIRMD